MDDKIKFSEWERFNFRVGTILKAENHPNADKLYVLKVDLGDEERTIVAGIKKAYTVKQLVGKKVIVFANLEPAMLRGVKSDGMVLAAVEGEKVKILTADKDIGNGAKIR